MHKRIDKEKFISLIKDGMTLMVGGFLTNGTPETLIDWTLESNKSNLTIICNDGGYPDKGVGKLIQAGRVSKLIASHIGTNPTAGELMQSNQMEVILVPQGTLAEQIRAGGAGLGGILTETGKGTVVELNKKLIEVKGITYLLEEPLKADIALIGGAITDKYGNLRYVATTRNFNPIMALAATTVVAEVYEIKDFLDPEIIITPHPLVDYIVVGENHG